MSPDRDVHLMYALVTDLAVAVFPEPVPIVMDVQPRLLAIDVDHEFVVARRTLPQFPVQICRDRTRFSMTDRVSVSIFVDVTARFHDLADESAVNQLHVANERRTR